MSLSTFVHISRRQEAILAKGLVKRLLPAINRSPTALEATRAFRAQAYLWFTRRQ